jgi:hypothetical protein
MPDRKPKPDRPTPRKEKICKTCKRPFHWTEQNARDWDILKFCSEACSGHHPGEKDTALEAAILQLLAEREADGERNKTICPSEAAKLVAGEPRNKSHTARRDWESLMEPARAAARRLVAQGRIVITQHNHRSAPPRQKGPSVYDSAKNGATFHHQNATNPPQKSRNPPLTKCGVSARAFCR